MESSERPKRPNDFEYSLKDFNIGILRGYSTANPPSIFYVWKKEPPRFETVYDALLNGIPRRNKQGLPEISGHHKGYIAYEVPPASLTTIMTAIRDFDFGLTDEQKRFLIFVALEKEIAEKKEEFAKTEVFESSPIMRDYHQAGRQININELLELQGKLIKRVPGDPRKP